MRLTKHHGWGNDFLVLIDADDGVVLDEETARAWCDRRRGVGADGVIRVTVPGDGADLAMELRNADGSRAEMSGNGIRCVAQAAWRAGVVAGPAFTVATDAGLRTVEVEGDPSAAIVQVRVDMGPAGDGDPAWADVVGPDGHGAQKVATLDLGNPHVVLLYGDAVARDTAVAAAPVGAPVNLEYVLAGPEPDALAMRVVERGVGETEACGTGAVAVAVAGRAWGLVGDRVVVHQPGGDAVVEIGATITLVGPATYVATVEVPWP